MMIGRTYRIVERDLDDSEVVSGHPVADPVKQKKYEDDLKKGDKFPPIEVEQRGWGHMIMDGCHRYAAHKAVGKKCNARISVRID